MVIIPELAVFYACALILVIGVLIALVRIGFLAYRFPKLAISVGATFLVLGGYGYLVATDDSTSISNIATTMKLPIPADAENCFVHAEGFEDTFVYFRCDVPATATPSLLAAAEWSAPVPIPNPTSGAKQPSGCWKSDRLPSWWNPLSGKSWIEVPQEQVGISAGRSGEPIIHSMLVDTTDASIHRVFMIHSVP